RHNARRGSTARAAGSWSLPLSPVGPPSSSHFAYAAAVATATGGVSSVNRRDSNGSGSTTSPTPLTRALPPTRQNGTSAPRLRASSAGRASGATPAAPKHSADTTDANDRRSILRR